MLAGRPATSAPPRYAAWPRSIGAVTRWKDAARAGLEAAFAAAQGTHDATRAAKGAIADGADAVAEGAAKVAHAPAEVAREVRRELDEWWSGVAKKLAGAAAAGVLALFALIVITVGAVVLLNRAVGDPYGTLAVGVAYALLAGIAIAWMQHAQRGSRQAEDAPRGDDTLQIEPASGAASSSGAGVVRASPPPSP